MPLALLCITTAVCHGAHGLSRFSLAPRSRSAEHPFAFVVFARLGDPIDEGFGIDLLDETMPLEMNQQAQVLREQLLEEALRVVWPLGHLNQLLVALHEVDAATHHLSLSPHLHY